MTNFCKSCIQGAMALVIGMGGVLATPVSSSAHIVCNRYGDCWSTHHRYRWPMRVGVRFYSDDWRRNHDWDHDRWHHWRGDRDDRGYWRNGVWISF